MIKESYQVQADDMSVAGDVSASIKRQMKRLGVPNQIMRRVSVCTYEAEINLVIHSDGGAIDFEITEDKIIVHVKDVGPGIPDIEKAMTEGYSTATLRVLCSVESSASLRDYAISLGESHLRRLDQPLTYATL